MQRLRGAGLRGLLREFGVRRAVIVSLRSVDLDTRVVNDLLVYSMRSQRSASW